MFDPKQVSLHEGLLKVFWESHDPTQGMRQGNDVGTQYRSGIYYYGDAQREAAERSREAFQQQLKAAGCWSGDDRDHPRAGVLLRGGLPSAVPLEESGRLLRSRRHRRHLPGRRRSPLTAVAPFFFFFFFPPPFFFFFKRLMSSESGHSRMAWWHWIVVGLILIALEMAASGGFYVIFFGIAAIAIGLLHALDLAGPLWFQFLLFSAISMGSLVLFRRPFMRWMKLDMPGSDVDSMIGETAVPLEDIDAGAVGRAELRGTVWSARRPRPPPSAKGSGAPSSPWTLR